MLTKEDINGILILSYLTDQMLEKLLPHMKIVRFGEQEVIFREGDQADMFYMLKSGKVLIEKRFDDKITILFGSVKPGYSFGWSAMLCQPYTTEALCSEPSEIIALDSKATLTLMEEDHSMGFILSQRLLRVIKKRLEFRTEQFIRAIINQPECKDLIDQV